MSGMKPGVAYYHLPEGQVLLEGNRPAEYWPLALVAAFARLQDSIAGAMHAYIYNMGAGHVADLLNKRHFARLTDDERWEYVKGLAKDVNFNAGLQQASDIYWSCKRTRDVVGHAHRLDLLYDPDLSLYRYVLDFRSKGVPEPLTPATLRLLATQCEWLQRLVEHLLFRGGGRFLGAGHLHDDGSVHPSFVEIPEPGPVPVHPEWDAPIGRTLPCEGPGCSWRSVDESKMTGSDPEALLAGSSHEPLT